jgi:CBS domain-containing protein
MQLSELLPREHVITPLRATTLRDALGELVARLAETGSIRDRDAIERGVTGPRARDIVAVTPDVVLPHYRTPAVETLQVALGIAPEGLDGRDMGIESRPRVVALILAPAEAATLYLQTVAALARVFREPVRIERIVSAASADDVIDAAGIEGLRLQPRLVVRDIMIHGVSSVTPQTTVRETLDLMLRRRLRAVPVVGEKQEVLGIVSEWDIMRGLLPQIPRAGQEDSAPDEAAGSMRVKDIMTRSVMCISEELGLEEAASMMINKAVEQFPVTNEGKLTGLLTRSDIIRKLFGR